MRTKWILLILLAATALTAQTVPDTLWSKRYILEGDEVAEDIILMPDNGFLMTGSNLVMRVDHLGDTFWTRSYGTHEIAELNTITPIDNDYILTGSTFDSDHLLQGWCLRITENGDTLWSRTYGTNGRCELHKAIWLDGTLFAAGSAFRDSTRKLWLIALSETGDSLWSEYWDIAGNENVNDMIVTPDNALLICGAVDMDDNQNGFALKCSTQGDSLWTQIYGGESEDSARKVVCTPEGDLLFCGYSGSFGAVNMDVWLFKTTSSGVVIWNRVYGDVEFEYARSMMLMPDGAMIVVGSSNSNASTNQDFYIAKRSADGGAVWSELLGGSHADAAYAICLADSGGFVVAGRSLSLPSTDFDIMLYRYEGLRADFHSDVQSGYQPLTVQFHSTSTGSITGWQWDTDGDGVFDAYGPNPLVVYEEDGAYDVSLVITDGTYTDSILREAYIQVGENEPPQIIAFTPADTAFSIRQGQQVQFNVEASDDHGIQHYDWFLDGETTGISLASWIYVFNESGDYTVTCRVSDGQFMTEANWRIEVTTSTEEPAPAVPETTRILHARPNPFNPSTVIRYQLNRRQRVVLELYNVRGQSIATLQDGVRDAGVHEVEWDAGKHSSGVYYLRMKTAETQQSYKLLLLK